MSKRFSVSAWRPYFDGSEFNVIGASLDWAPPLARPGTGISSAGWFCLTVSLLGFGVSLTYWRHHKPDVYGDGGVA